MDFGGLLIILGLAGTLIMTYELGKHEGRRGK